MELPVLRGSAQLTHSRMQTYKACQRRHWFRYELGLRRERTDAPLRMGSAYHLGLDLAAQGVAFEDICARIDEQYAVVPTWIEDPADWHVEREVVLRLLSGHIWRWGEDGFETIASELIFDVPVRNPETNGQSTLWTVAGKIDRIVRLPDGRLAVMEFKTCREDISPESDYWRRLRIDQQISLYVVAARELGHEVATVLYDVTRKPSIEPRQIPLLDAEGCKIVLDGSGNRVMNANGKPRQSADTAQGWVLQTRRETPEEFGERFAADIQSRPDFYFARMEIPRLEADLDEFRAELWQQQRQIRESQRTARWFRNTDRCLKPFPCEYSDFCFNGITPSADSAPPEGWVIAETVHPELD